MTAWRIYELVTGVAGLALMVLLVFGIAAATV
jgi:hypothetical protein